MSTIKTIGDLPKFRVSAMSPAERHDLATGDSKLSGTFDKVEGVSEGNCYLLLPEKDVLVGLAGELRFLEVPEKTASFHTKEESIPEVGGKDLTYLSGLGRWEPYHVWMVIEPRWKWKRSVYKAEDVTAKPIKDTKVSVVDGQEVWEWIEIKKVGKETGLKRYYPVFPDGGTKLLPADPSGIIPGGWNHEHCELCQTHIDAGEYGYVDRGEHWVCEACYDRYVVNHDLSFLNP